MLLIKVLIRIDSHGDTWREDYLFRFSSPTEVQYDLIACITWKIVQTLKNIVLDVGPMEPIKFLISPLKLVVGKLEDAFGMIKFVCS